MRRNPGRPKGSKTEGETVGKKRARRFFDLTIDQGVPSLAAADQVADEFSSTSTDVYKAAKRHNPALAAEFMREAIEIEKDLDARRAALIGPPAPSGIDRLLRIAIDEFSPNKTGDV